MVVRTERLSGPRNCRFVMYPRFSSQATDRSYGLYCGHPGPIMCWTVNETCFQAAQHRCWPLKSQCVPTARSRQPFQSFRHALAPALNRAFPCLHGPWTGSRVLGSEDRVCQCCSAHVLTAWSEAWAERVDTRGLKQHGAQGRLQAFASCTRVTASARHRGRGGAFESVGSAARSSTKCSLACESAKLRRREKEGGGVRQALRVNSVDRRFLSSPGVARSYGRTAVRPFSEQGVVLGGAVVRLAGALRERPGTTPSASEAACQPPVLLRRGPGSERSIISSTSPSRGLRAAWAAVERRSGTAS